jgi:hypothetical protein
MTSTKRSVTFRNSFQAPGMDDPHPPGTFDVMVDVVELDVPWPAHRTALTLLLRGGGHVEALPITGADLDRLLVADAQKDLDTGHS